MTEHEHNLTGEELGEAYRLGLTAAEYAEAAAQGLTPRERVLCKHMAITPEAYKAARGVNESDAEREAAQRYMLERMAGSAGITPEARAEIERMVTTEEEN